MKIVKKTVGDGISKRTRSGLSFDPNEPEDVPQIIEFFESIAQKGKLPWRDKADQIQQLKNDYNELTKDAPDEDREKEAYDRYYKKYSSVPWFIRTAAQKVHRIESAMEDDGPWEAVVEALELGSLLCEFDFRQRFGEAPLFGDKQMGKLKRGGESHRKHLPEVVAGFVESLLDPNNPNGARNKSEAVSIAAEEFGIAISTVYDKLKKAKLSTPDAGDKSR